MDSLESAYYEDDAFWADGMVEDHANLTRIDKTIELLPASVTSLLDAGCGNGVFAHRLSRARPEVRITCVDRSATALSHVRIPDKRRASIDALPAAPNEVDCVTCLQVLEHLQVPVYDKALSELARVSNKYIVAGVPYRERTERNVTTCPQCKTTFNVDLHLRQFDEDTFARMFEPHGFRLTTTIFPLEFMAYRGFEILGRLRSLAQRPSQQEGFRAPVCPVCGYTRSAADSGDRGQPDPGAPEAGEGRRRLGSARRVVKRLWPKQRVRGYWMVGLFSKR